RSASLRASDRGGARLRSGGARLTAARRRVPQTAAHRLVAARRPSADGDVRLLLGCYSAASASASLASAALPSLAKSWRCSSSAMVASSSSPVGSSLANVWKAVVAALVFLPTLPSTPFGSKPRFI